MPFGKICDIHPGQVRKLTCRKTLPVPDEHQHIRIAHNDENYQRVLKRSRIIAQRGVEDLPLVHQRGNIDNVWIQYDPLRAG